MSGSLARAAPVRFLIGVAAAWTMARGVALVGWGPPAPPSVAPKAFFARVATTPPPLAAQPSPVLSYLLLAAFHVPGPISATEAWRGMTRPLPSPTGPNDGAGPLLMLAAYSSARSDAYARSSGFPEAATTAGQPADKRFSGSAWAFLRGGGRATALSPGQIGGG